MQTKERQIGLQIKSMDDDGSFEGYGSVFDVVDSYNERVAKGAFVRSIEEKGASGIALLWQHRGGEPIGVWEEMREDERGLFMRGNLNMDTQRGREAYALMKQGAIKGLSIGFMVRQSSEDRESGITTLTDIDLWEVSVVTFPANSAAQISAVKMFLDGQTPDERTLERALRDLGMSKRQAQGLMAKGYKGISNEREAEAETLTLVPDFIRLFSVDKKGASHE